MARLDALVIGGMGHDDALAAVRIERVERQQALALGLGLCKVSEQLFRIGAVKVVAAVFFLGLAEDIAVFQRNGAVGIVEGHVHDMIDAQHIHRQTLQPIGQLTRDRAAVMPTDLLEIGELADFHAVAPDFPAKTPGAQGGAFPVVLDKADVMQRGIDADGVQAAQIQILQIGRRGFDQHLILVIVLQAVGVFPITPVGRPARGLDVGRGPGLVAQAAQRGRRVEGPCPHLHVIGLQHSAALVAPIGHQAQDDFLKAAGRGHCGDGHSSLVGAV